MTEQEKKDVLRLVYVQPDCSECVVREECGKQYETTNTDYCYVLREKLDREIVPKEVDE